MSGQGSTGNVVAALASFFVPGLGQLLQGRILAAMFYAFLAVFLWLVFLGGFIHVIACIDAAVYRRD